MTIPVLLWFGVTVAMAVVLAKSCLVWFRQMTNTTEGRQEAQGFLMARWASSVFMFVCVWNAIIIRSVLRLRPEQLVVNGSVFVAYFAVVYGGIPFAERRMKKGSASGSAA